MNSDIPVELLLHPPSTDIECSLWGILAPSLYQQGLIWRNFEQVICNDSPPQLRILCTFTDKHAFDTWQSHPIISSNFADVLATPIEVSCVTTPCEKHEQVCKCSDSSQFILRPYGFGDSKALLYCGDCLGYYPPYRVQQEFETINVTLESWALITMHVYEIWLATSTLEDWANKQLSDPSSEINVAGFSNATKISQYSGKKVWYYLFVAHDDTIAICPKCNSTTKASKWTGPTFQCDTCCLLY